MRPKYRWLSSALAFALCLPLQTAFTRAPEADVEFADSKSSAPPVPTEEPPLSVAKLKIHPAPVSTPAIRYRFTPRPIDQEDGNAALYYMNAAILINQLEHTQEYKVGIDEIGDSEKPLDKDGIKKAENILQRFEPVLNQVRLGAKQRDCSWTGDNATNFDASLARFRPLRAIARLLAARIRLDLARGDLEQAAATMQVAMTYARHIAQGPTLVHALVGVAIDGILVTQFWEMMQLADCPNLYWSLASIPDPPISISNGLDYDADGVYFLFPALRDLASQTKSSEEWTRLLQETLDWFVKAENHTWSDAPWLKDLPRTSEKMIAKYEKQSIEFLKTRGYDESVLAKMPKAKAVLLHTTIGWNEAIDQMFRWRNIPFWQAFPHLPPGTLKTKPEDQSPIPLAESLGPAFRASRMAHARLTRHFAGLRVVEAIRDYAYHNGGKLPKSLDDIKNLSLPIDPYTGNAFVYRLENGKAILDGPPPHGSKSGIHALRWEIEIAK